MDRDTEAMRAGAISKFVRENLLMTSSTIADHRVPNDGEHALGQDDIIEPEDSIPIHGYQQRIITSSSRSSESRTSSHNALTIKREIKLTAQAIMIRKRQEIEARKRELQRRLEEEDWKT